MPLFDDDLPSLDTALISARDDSKDHIPPVSQTLSGLRDARANRLKLGEPIARGGMGTVHIAGDKLLQQKVAVKILHPNMSDDPEAVERFIHEARITAQLDHPNIVPVYDIGHMTGEGLYFTMKLVEGQTLSQIVRNMPLGGISPGRLAELLDVILRVCDALAFAHARGILHCDLKPSNIMVGEFGQVYLMDWGMARRWQTNPLPTDGRIYGTVGYMPPEQARSEAIDPRADVFGIGAILYHLFARKAPFRRPLLEQSLYAAMINRALEASPDDRYISVMALREDLARYLRGKMDFPRRHVPAGFQIIQEGEVGESAYILVSGRCEVFRIINGQRKTLRLLEPGTIFGETAILARSQRSANVMTLEDCLLMEVTREVLEQELTEMKPWMGVLLKTLARYFHERETGPRS